MIRATLQDRERIVFLLSQSFIDNQSVNYIVGQAKDKTTRIQALMSYSFDVCFHFGEVYLSDEKSACALILLPGSKRTSLLSIWLDIKLVFNAIGVFRISAALKRESAIKKLQLQKDHLYLWFVGVHPAEQHRGIGTQLLQAIISYANTRSLPVCLETSTVANLPWYKKNGFEVYNELDLGYRLYFLKTSHHI